MGDPVNDRLESASQWQGLDRHIIQGGYEDNIHPINKHGMSHYPRDPSIHVYSSL